MPGLNKQSNEYVDEMNEYYDMVPKAVFAAIALSFALNLAEDNFTAAKQLIINEWKALYDNHIVPQSPILTHLQQLAKEKQRQENDIVFNNALKIANKQLKE